MEKKKTTTTESEEKPVKNDGKYIYAKGGRKTATAQTRLFKAGKGKFVVNGIDYEKYFPTVELKRIFLGALVATGFEKTMDVEITVVGGGVVAQAEACRHGMARALEIFDEALRPVLKAQGFMIRDPRVKERKKPGLRKARRAPQWAKR